MGAYISLNQVLALAEKATNSSFRQIPRKKIMFRTTTAEGKSVTLCSPQSKLHSQGFFWVDITQEQYRVLSETDSGLPVGGNEVGDGEVAGAESIPDSKVYAVQCQ